MGYRISYTEREGPWKTLKIQSVIAAGLLAVCMVYRLFYPEAVLLVGPNPAQQAMASCYVRGEGLRESLIQYCAAALECAGYETEAVR